MSAKDIYMTGLRNQHAVEGQAVSTIEAQLGRLDRYPDLRSKMQEEIQQSKTQATRLETLMSKHGTSASTVKEAVTTVVGKVSGVVHAPSSDDVVKDTLSAIGFKAYEIASYKALIAMAEAAGASDDVGVLKQSMEEEQKMGDWLGEHVPSIVNTYVSQAA